MAEANGFNFEEIERQNRDAHPITYQLMSFWDQIPQDPDDLDDEDDPEVFWQRFNTMHANRKNSEHREQLGELLADVISPFQTTGAFQRYFRDIFESFYRSGKKKPKPGKTVNERYSEKIFFLVVDLNKPEMTDYERGKLVETRCFKLELAEFLKSEDEIIGMKEDYPHLSPYGQGFFDALEERRAKLVQWEGEYEERYKHKPFEL